MIGKDGKEISTDGLAALMELYASSNMAVNLFVPEHNCFGPEDDDAFINYELECSGAVLKELDAAGFIKYKPGGIVSITFTGKKYLEENFRRGL